MDGADDAVQSLEPDGIDSDSPLPFLSSLFMSRRLVAYTVAMCMFGVGALALYNPTNVNELLLMATPLGSLMFLSMGRVIFLFSNTVMAFHGVVNAVQFPLITLGGMFFSVSLFPGRNCSRK